MGNWEQYDGPFEKAVELDPRDVDLLWDYGGFAHERMGRHADAIRWYNRALALAPDLASAALDKGWAYVWWQGRLDTLRTVMASAPVQQLLRNRWLRYHYDFLLIDRQADSLLTLLKWAQAAGPAPRVRQAALVYTPDPLYAAWAHELRGDRVAARAAFDSARVMLDSAIGKFPEDWPVHQARGMAMAGLGRRDEALREARWLRRSFIYRKDLFLRPYVEIGAAQILARAGEADAAVDDLERLLADRASALSVHALRLQPVWDPLREHPRFRALLARYGA